MVVHQANLPAAPGQAIAESAGHRELARAGKADQEN
jgi:hypothetical protein